MSEQNTSSTSDGEQGRHDADDANRDVESTATADSHERRLEDVLAQVELLREENRRLRESYVRAKQTQYRSAAVVLVLFGCVAIGGGLLFPDSRATLFGLAGIGIVAAILIYFLTPHSVATSTVGERSYATLAILGRVLQRDLGLQDVPVYVPANATNGGRFGGVRARLFLPLNSDYVPPEDDQLESMFVVETDDQKRGVALPPTGGLLYQEFRRTMVDDVSTTSDALLEQITEALESGFELAESTIADVDVDEGTVKIGVQGSTFGDIDRFDHPLPSFVSTCLAVDLQTPVEQTDVTTDAPEFDYLVTCTWDPDAVRADADD